MHKRLVLGALSSALLAGSGCASSAIEALNDDAATGYEPAAAAADPADAGAVLPNPMDAGGPRDSGLATSDARAADASSPVDAGHPLDAATHAPTDAGPPSGSTAKDAALPVAVDAGVDTGKPVVDAAQPIAEAPSGCTAQTYKQHSYFFCSETLSWVAARGVCLGAGLDLAIINDEGESAFVAGNDESWIGETDKNQEGTYLDVVLGDAQRTDGTPVTFLNWASGEPNNARSCDGVSVGGTCIGKRGADEDCIVVLNNAYFNDATCDANKGFVCEQY